MAERVGAVSKIEQQPGKRPWKATVGGRIVNFWPKAFESEDDSAIHELLKAALESQVLVEVLGKEDDVLDENGNPRFLKDGKTPKVSFMAETVRPSPQTPPSSPQNGSQTRSEPSGDKKYVGREPGEADYWLAMRWAYSTALDLLTRTGEPPTVDEISVKAGELFFRSRIEALQAKEKANE